MWIIVSVVVVAFGEAVEGRCGPVRWFRGRSTLMIMSDRDRHVLIGVQALGSLLKDLALTSYRSSRYE